MPIKKLMIFSCLLAVLMPAAAAHAQDLQLQMRQEEAEARPAYKQLLQEKSRLQAESQRLHDAIQRLKKKISEDPEFPAARGAQPQTAQEFQQFQSGMTERIAEKYPQLAALEQQQKSISQQFEANFFALARTKWRAIVPDSTVSLLFSVSMRYKNTQASSNPADNEFYFYGRPEDGGEDVLLNLTPSLQSIFDQAVATHTATPNTALPHNSAACRFRGWGQDTVLAVRAPLEHIRSGAPIPAAAVYLLDALFAGRCGFGNVIPAAD